MDTSLKKYRDVFEITSDGLGMIDSYLDEQRADLGDESLQWWEGVESNSLIISPDEKKAVETYADEKYNLINQYLRTSETPEGWNKEDLDLIVSSLSSVIEKAPEISEITVWRGLGQKTGERIFNSQISRIWYDEAFQSTSLSFDTAKNFAKPWFTISDKFPHYTILRLITTGNQKGFFYGLLDENEIIFKPNTNWKIVSKDEIALKDSFKGNKKIYYHIVTMVGV